MRKLMKYEFRALWRIFVPCWLAILALGFLNSLTLYQPNHNPWGAMLSAMGVFFYVLGTMAVLVLALVFVIGRFYNGLLKSSGYLMFTLPVSTDSLIWSKAVFGVLIWAGTGLCCLLSLLLLGRAFPGMYQGMEAFWQSVRAYFTAGGQAILIAMGVLLVCLAIASVFTCIFQCYLSMSLGHLASKGRVVLSILAFLGINMVKSTIFNTGVMGIAAESRMFEPLLNAVKRFFDMWGVSQQSTESALGLLLVGLLVVLLLEIIEGMLYYFFTRMILKKRPNLD